MIPVLSRAQARAFDNHAIQVLGVPSVVLMENAGRGAAHIIIREVLDGASGARISVACGTGNNGGDGFVVARHLLAHGFDVRVALVGDPGRLTQDARLQYEIFRRLGADRVVAGDGLFQERSCDVMVDALFGTGLDRGLSEPHRTIIERMNEGRFVRVALDLPSGLDADRGIALGQLVRAEWTVTFGHTKRGLWTPVAADHVGALRVVDLGVPSELPPNIGSIAQLLEAGDVAPKARSAGAHKYTAGHVLALAGSPGKSGAALLVGKAALRAGAGAVTLATWPSVFERLAGRLPELMTAPLTGVESLGALLRGKRAVVCGPGFGLDADAKAIVEQLLAVYDGPLVCDADVLTLIGTELEKFRRQSSARSPIVLTPHAGELSRMLGCAVDEVDRDRFTAVTEAARRSGAVVLLKGRNTLIADPERRLAISPTGNEVLATAGSGDVLSGMVASFLLEMPPFEAACAAAFVHGKIGDLWRREHTDRGLLASDLADCLPRAMGELARSPTV